MVPLQTKTAFSLLQSPMMPSQLVASAKAKGYTAVAMTDNDVLYGMDNFYRAAKSADIKPILGLTITIQGLATSQHYPIVLLVENQTGYHNLLAISSLLKTTSEAVTFDMLTAYLAGLYIVLPSVGELPVILGAEPDRAMAMVQGISAVTDANHVFLGVSTGMRDELITQLRQLSENTGARLLALTEVDYADPQD